MNVPERLRGGLEAEQTGRWCGQVQYYKIGQQLLLGDGKREFSNTSIRNFSVYMYIHLNEKRRKYFSKIRIIKRTLSEKACAKMFEIPTKSSLS